jgi:hypothetical protein
VKNKEGKGKQDLKGRQKRNDFKNKKKITAIKAMWST